jgi:hypothetical protein
MRTRKVFGEPNVEEAPHGGHVSNEAASKGKKTASTKQQTKQGGAKRKAVVATEKKGQENLRHSSRLKKQKAIAEPAPLQVGRVTSFDGQDERVASGERVTAAVCLVLMYKQKAKVGDTDDDSPLAPAVVVSKKRKVADDDGSIDRHKRARYEESTRKFKDLAAVALEQPIAIYNYIRVGDFIDAGRDDPSEDPVPRFRIDSYSNRVRNGYY